MTVKVRGNLLITYSMYTIIFKFYKPSTRRVHYTKWLVADFQHYIFFKVDISTYRHRWLSSEGIKHAR